MIIKIHFTAIEEKSHTVDNLKEQSAVIDMLGNSMSPVYKCQYKWDICLKTC